MAVIGIDLGTTNSVAARSGEVIPLSEDAVAVLPSVKRSVRMICRRSISDMGSGESESPSLSGTAGRRLGGRSSPRISSPGANRVKPSTVLASSRTLPGQE